jgi:soluble lytic murein transglycosylase-like protein
MVLNTDFDAEIMDAAKRYGLHPQLVTAVVMRESTGRTNAYRYEPGVWEWFKTNEHAKGLNKYRAAASYGLMQVLYATATDYGYVTDPEYLFLPKVGLDLGCRHLAEMIKWAKAIYHSHSQPTTVARATCTSQCPQALRRRRLPQLHAEDRRVTNGRHGVLL